MQFSKTLEQVHGITEAEQLFGLAETRLEHSSLDDKTTLTTRFDFGVFGKLDVISHACGKPGEAHATPTEEDFVLA